MISRQEADSLAQIALEFLDGDDFERILIDQRLHTDYRFDEFNRLKAVLTKVERLKPGMDVTAVLWRLYPGNPYVGEPLVAGNALPNGGWRRVMVNSALRQTVRDGVPRVCDWGERGKSYYYPLRNSDWEIVGALELLTDRGFKQDVGTAEMFQEKLELENSEELEASEACIFT